MQQKMKILSGKKEVELKTPVELMLAAALKANQRSEEGASVMRRLKILSGTLLLVLNSAGCGLL
ncbi:MAG: hypothetical protein WCB68_21625, partial [Pyrinomonadaceae bacterium]